ncbi:aminotransferase [Geranomyces variabilis]|uniref:Ubiquitin thioesterase OTU n=1 Tax=Geranomyces variabilis TaxID=109894 RepID=A0AAD5XN89_9FUNG|nr:aminotransferase [Geranomyces variabilis]
MRLRCRSPKGQHTLGSALLPASPLTLLLAEIQDATGIPPHLQSLRVGFPPKPIAETLSQDTNLRDAGISDGDTLVVEEASGAKVNDSGLRGLVAAATSTPPSKPPSSSSSASAAAAAAPGSEAGVPVAGGTLLVRQMPDDNSCLFRSIAYVLDREAAPSKLRKNAIRAAPQTYSEAVLGRSPKTYCDWIMKDGSWGGGIELAIFAEHYGFEIDSIDVSSLRVDRFGEGGNHSSRVFIFYTGIHYDAVALTPTPSAPAAFDQTTFDVLVDKNVADAAEQLAQAWNRAKKFTDLARFALRCGDCGQGLKGQNEAQAHAMSTGHSKFTEV